MTIQRKHIRKSKYGKPFVAGRRKIYYPTVQDIIDTNRELVEQMRITKAEKHGLLRDRWALDNVILKAKAKRGDIHDKAAVLLRELVRGHYFESGNRRTAFSVAQTFIVRNEGSARLIRRETGERFLLDIREGRKSPKAIKEWLKGN